MNRKFYYRSFTYSFFFILFYYLHYRMNLIIVYIFYLNYLTLRRRPDLIPDPGNLRFSAYPGRCGLLQSGYQNYLPFSSVQGHELSSTEHPVMSQLFCLINKQLFLPAINKGGLLPFTKQLFLRKYSYKMLTLDVLIKPNYHSLTDYNILSTYPQTSL